MTAPSLASIGAINSGTDITRAPAVPSGVVAGAFTMVFLGSTQNFTPAAADGGGDGTDFLFEVSSAAANISLFAEYRVASGSDAGTYTVPGHSTAGSFSSDAIAARFINVDTAAPFFGTTSVTAVNSGTTLGAVSLSSLPVDTYLVHFVECGASRTYTPPAGFTRQSAAASQRLHMSDMSFPAGGNTGSLTGSISSSTFHKAALIALLPISSPAAQNSGFLGLL
jgi:hypothetical protein